MSGVAEISGLRAIISEASSLRATVSRGPGRHVDADDVQVLSGNLRRLTGFLAELGTLYDVREWHAADQASVAATEGSGDE